MEILEALGNVRSVPYLSISSLRFFFLSDPFSMLVHYTYLISDDDLPGKQFDQGSEMQAAVHIPRYAQIAR
jgi:hypothetical protein